VSKKIALRLTLTGLLLLAGCVESTNGSNPGNSKNSGFYSGVSGGWSHP
jgi:hypothetical protein